MELDEYILRHIDAEGELLHALWRDTQLRLAYGQMASGHLQGRLLKMLVQIAYYTMQVTTTVQIKRAYMLTLRWFMTTLIFLFLYTTYQAEQLLT